MVWPDRQVFIHHATSITVRKDSVFSTESSRQVFTYQATLTTDHVKPVLELGRRGYEETVSKRLRRH